MTHYLVTGGCGFIGSHLSESLLQAGHRVTVVDDLSTGVYSNVAELESHADFQLVIGTVLDAALMAELIKDTEAVFHLASAVGVRLIMEQPVRTIDTIFMGTDTVLKAANRYRRPVLLTSTSEVYGKSVDIPFDEDGDRLAGATNKHRWAYACAKALDEFMALAYYKETRLPVTIARLFNTVGPRQTGQYGMVIPGFVRQALAGEPITVYGDGQQSRCFAHVLDVVQALIGIMKSEDCRGQVLNVGAQEEITVLQLAETIRAQAGSQSEIKFVPYEEAFGEGFEEMQRRVPSIEKIKRLIGWTPVRSLDDIIADVVHDMQS